MTNKTTTEYGVWVGGVEVNDYFLSQEMADAIAELFDPEGCNNVVIEVVPLKQERNNNGRIRNTKSRRRHLERPRAS